MNEIKNKLNSEQYLKFEKLVDACIKTIQTISFDRIQELTNVSRTKTEKYFLSNKPKTIFFFYSPENYKGFLGFEKDGSVSNISTSHPKLIKDFFGDLDIAAAFGEFNILSTSDNKLLVNFGPLGQTTNFWINFIQDEVKISGADNFIKNHLNRI